MNRKALWIMAVLFVVSILMLTACGGGGGGGGGAKSNTLDTTFNTTGIVTTPIGTNDDYGEAVAIQSDGKIVAAGYTNNGGQYVFTLVRYNTNGSLDTTFNTTGIVTTPIGTVYAEALAVAFQSDGKIVAAGTSLIGGQYVIALVRYNTDGSLDTTFNTTGIVTTSIGTRGVLNAVAIQSDGKIVAAGNSLIGGQGVFTLVRYNTNGSLDTTFNTTGIVTTSIGTRDDAAFAVAIQSDGKIVASGTSLIGGQWVFALVRYNTNGSLDTTFKTTGIVTTSIGTSDDEALSVAIQSDGKIVASGYSNNGRQNVFALVRYNTNGSLDTTFNTTGIATTSIGTSDDKAHAVAIQSDGKIVASGYSDNGSQNVFALVRYNTNGSLDTTFNTTGIMTTSIGTSDDEALSVAIQSDGKIVASGYSDNGSQYVFALVRYMP